MEDVKRVYANIRLPIDVYLNGEFKMLYDQMQVKMDMIEVSEITNMNSILTSKVTEIEKEIEDRMYVTKDSDEQQKETKDSDEPEEENDSDDQEEDEIKIYISDYPLNKCKKRWNTTFKKNIKRNQITKKNYLVIDNIEST